ncbi:allergen Tab y 5.0101-like [Scaptodrosophila lebanonensis]|uniref:Allergen Tab y 5.0101-like n=1 Tax=Drosophila lebanonensis TaxID=7225 RepID=A0A6J2T302_DROLE|nr:allergen Tab y 5.0101-like [Scaptodrosophila lebanonensis]
MVAGKPGFTVWFLAMARQAQWLTLLALVLSRCLYCISLQDFQNFKSHTYCVQPKCGLTNLACHNSGNFSAHCKSGVRVVPLGKYKPTILNMINEFRNTSAHGYTRTLFPAARMVRMIWSEELMQFAVMDVIRCLPRPRPCMSSPHYRPIGSIFDQFNYPGSIDIHTNINIIRTLIERWIADASYVSKSLSMYLTPALPKPSVRRPILLMSDRNSHVGCAALRFTNEYYHHFHISCAFSTDTMLHKPIYKIGPSAGSSCRRLDRKYKNLCAPGERYPYVHKEWESGSILPED